MLMVMDRKGYQRWVLEDEPSLIDPHLLSSLSFPKNFDEFMKLSPRTLKGSKFVLFVPAGEWGDKPPYAGMNIEIGYDYDWLASMQCVNDAGHHGAYYCLMYAIGDFSSLGGSIEVIVPYSRDDMEISEQFDILDLVYENALMAFHEKYLRDTIYDIADLIS